MKIYVDIDGTICTIVKDGNYKDAQPIQENIEIINNLYKRGHRITYWTARGSETKIDWRLETVTQFKEWGVKYHALEFYKPVYDLFIDDKAINARSLKRFKEV
jgi:CMP-N,N'-diacetyllegionaminic acid synthase